MTFFAHDEQQRALPEKLLEFIAQQQEQIVQLQRQVEVLEGEIRRLKKLPAEPDIKYNTTPHDDAAGSAEGDEQPAVEDNDTADPDATLTRQVNKPDEKTRKQPSKPPPEKSVTIETTGVPPGSTWNGYTPFHVQELTINTSSIEYQLEQWITPDRKAVTAKPPVDLHGHHYGLVLQAYVLHQHHGCSGYIQTDDTGTRHKGKNGYCTIINNESFAWFASKGSKSRENFMSLLHRPWRTYTLTEEALSYLKEHHYPQKWLRILKPYNGVAFLNRQAWEAFMDDHGLTGKKRRQQASEALIYGSLIQDGAGHLTTFSDGARQFDIFKHSQCWIHAERGLAKVHPVNDQQAMAQKWCRTWFWAIYDDLKAFRAEPDAEKALKVWLGFHMLIQTRTCCKPLQEALSGLALIKEELLFVLKDPNLPLHNNLSESQIREYAKRRKISGGTRSDAGRQCRDTFASLKKTCRLYGLSFWDYLTDRLTGNGLFPRLAGLIEKASRALPCGLCRSF